MDRRLEVSAVGRGPLMWSYVSDLVRCEAQGLIFRHNIFVDNMGLMLDDRR